MLRADVQQPLALEDGGAVPASFSPEKTAGLKRLAVIRQGIARNYPAPRDTISGANIARNLLDDLASAPDPRIAAELTCTAIFIASRDRAGIEGFANTLAPVLLRGCGRAWG